MRLLIDEFSIALLLFFVCLIEWKRIYVQVLEHEQIACPKLSHAPVEVKQTTCTELPRAPNEI